MGRREPRWAEMRVTITSMRERSDGGSAETRAHSWSASRSKVGAKRATPSSRYAWGRSEKVRGRLLGPPTVGDVEGRACAAAAFATLSEKSPVLCVEGGWRGGDWDGGWESGAAVEARGGREGGESAAVDPRKRRALLLRQLRQPRQQPRATHQDRVGAVELQQHAPEGLFGRLDDPTQARLAEICRDWPR